jgi:hypothetical protein
MKTVVRKKKQKTANEFPMPKYDMENYLPYNLGFDDIIEDRAIPITSLKTRNIHVMDELIKKLGYLDYRDFLALNKYIFDAKKSEDAHQRARASTLQSAIAKWTS